MTVMNRVEFQAAVNNFAEIQRIEDLILRLAQQGNEGKSQLLLAQLPAEDVIRYIISGMQDDILLQRKCLAEAGINI